MSDNGKFTNDAREHEEIIAEVPEETIVHENQSDRRNERWNRGLLGRVREGWEIVGHVVRKIPDSKESSLTAIPAIANDVFEEGNGSADDLTRDVAKWTRRRDIPLAILGWAGVLFILFWGAGHITRTIILLVIAALLAYALAPAVSFLQRVVPRFVATLIVYLVVLSCISALMYFIVRTASQQITSLASYINKLLTPGNNGKSPLEGALQSFGISQSQISGVGSQLINQMEGVTGSILPFITEFFNVILDVILTAILSIYLLADGEHFTSWLRQNTPRKQRGRVRFFLNTLQRIVGGYIRGQLFLCALIGVLVGVGMTVIGVPYALLLGVLAFVLEFIPVLGTLISGAICVLLALTNGWVSAVVVLVYFVIVHIIEGDIVGPRVVGKAIGLHPIVSLAALVAGAELFGIWGALFASPVAGVIQAFLVAIWSEWRATHPQEFQQAKDSIAGKIEQNVTNKALEQEDVEERLLS